MNEFKIWSWVFYFTIYWNLKERQTEFKSSLAAALHHYFHVYFTRLCNSPCPFLSLTVFTHSFLQDPQVDCYRTSRVQTELQLSRENMVGLAVLLGCDYIPKVGTSPLKFAHSTHWHEGLMLTFNSVASSKGIPGVGKEQALKLIQTLKEQTLLQK